MTRLHPRQAMLLVAALLLGLTHRLAIAAAPLVTEDTVLQVTIGGRGYALEALIVKPAGVSGRLPVALIAHGSPRDRAERPAYRARAELSMARELAHRGWLAVAFLRRGFGTSEGPYAEGFACASPNYPLALATAAEDIEAVRVAIAKRPDADATRVLGLGVSVGGASMLSWAATQPPGLVGVVSLSGGTGALMPERNCDEDALVATFASLGGRVRVPTLWLYAENDSYFGPRLVRRMHGAFTRAGADATLTLLPSVGPDGHQLWRLYEGRILWLPALDRFLRLHRLPTWAPGPLEALARRLSPPARRVLAAYLDAPTEKALALARDRRVARYWAGTVDAQSARQTSLALCEQDSGGPCEILIENFTASTY
jgi:dienelactone hydrolase